MSSYPIEKKTTTFESIYFKVVLTYAFKIITQKTHCKGT